MPEFRDLQRVRVVRLLDEDRPFDGSRSALRPPAVGDVGLVVDIVPNVSSYLVESVDAAGRTVWLASFDASELEDAEDGPEKAG